MIQGCPKKSVTTNYYSASRLPPGKGRLGSIKHKSRQKLTLKPPVPVRFCLLNRYSLHMNFGHPRDH